MGNNRLLHTLFKVRPVCIIIGILLYTFSACAGYGKNESVTVHFIDVGEGEATLVQTPDGKNILIDTGNIISGYALVTYLQKIHVTSLDYLILTHMHPDHIGGSFFVAQMLDVKNIRDNGEDISKDAVSPVLYDSLYYWFNTLIRKNENWDLLNAGDSFFVGNVNIAVLWPPHPFPFPGSNPRSLVLMLQYNDFKILLTGDAPSYVEEELLKKGYDLNAHVLKVGHHGHHDATSEEYVKAVSPAVSIISINKDNIRGYPSPDVIERLQKHHSDIYKTFYDGTIIIKISEKGTYKVITKR